jgi:hypothetical protein
MGALTAAGLVLADVAGALGYPSPASAEPVWYHPFTTWAEKTSDYGPRVPPCRGCSSDHKGLDYAPGPSPVLIHSVAAGTVTKARLGGSFGYFVEIDHGGSFSSVYAHMRAGSLRVSQGDVIPAGTVLGIMGATGSATGIHLHVELHLNGTPIDPTSRIHRAPPASAVITPPPVPLEEDMSIHVIRRVTDGALNINGMVCAVGPRFFTSFGSIEEAARFAALFTKGGAIIDVTAQEFNLTIAVFQIPIGQCVPGNAWAA